MEEYSLEEIKDKLEKSLETLYEKERYLLEKSANERSLTHKLAEYLKLEFPNYDVDCEYNLDIDSNTGRKTWISEDVKMEIEKILNEIKQSLEPKNFNISEEVNSVLNKKNKKELE